jgi:O-antigen ligase
MMGSAMLFAMMFSKMGQKRRNVHLMSAVFVGISFSVLFLHIGEGAALGAMGRNATLTGRTEIWEGLMNFSVNPWVGTGFENFWVGERLAKIWAAGGLLNGINESHNGYIEVYLNLGWIGVVLLAAVLFSGYRHAMNAFRRDPEAGKLKLVFLLVSVVYCFTEAGFRIMSPIWTAFLLAITAVPYPASARRAHSRTTGQQAAVEPEVGEFAMASPAVRTGRS